MEEVDNIDDVYRKIRDSIFLIIAGNNAMNKFKIDSINVKCVDVTGDFATYEIDAKLIKAKDND